MKDNNHIKNQTNQIITLHQTTLQIFFHHIFLNNKSVLTFHNLTIPKAKLNNQIINTDVIIKSKNINTNLQIKNNVVLQDPKINLEIDEVKSQIIQKTTISHYFSKNFVQSFFIK